MKEINVTIKKEKFRSTSYLNNSDCALARTLKEVYNTTDVSVGGDIVFIDFDDHQGIYLIVDPDAISNAYKKEPLEDLPVKLKAHSAKSINQFLTENN